MATVLQETDGNNLPQVAYTRGLDLSGRWERLPRERGLERPSLVTPGLLPTPTRTAARHGFLSRGKGGIGGLLARTDDLLLLNDSSRAHAFYHADENGNVTCLIKTQQLVVARYVSWRDAAHESAVAGLCRMVWQNRD
jgi:hypothetical protein